MAPSISSRSLSRSCQSAIWLVWFILHYRRGGRTSNRIKPGRTSITLVGTRGRTQIILPIKEKLYPTWSFQKAWTIKRNYFFFCCSKTVFVGNYDNQPPIGTISGNISVFIWNLYEELIDAGMFHLGPISWHKTIAVQVENRLIIKLGVFFPEGTYC